MTFRAFFEGTWTGTLFAIVALYAVTIASAFILLEVDDFFITDAERVEVADQFGAAWGKVEEGDFLVIRGTPYPVLGVSNTSIGYMLIVVQRTHLFSSLISTNREYYGARAMQNHKIELVRKSDWRHKKFRTQFLEDDSLGR